MSLNLLKCMLYISVFDYSKGMYLEVYNPFSLITTLFVPLLSYASHAEQQTVLKMLKTAEEAQVEEASG